MIETYQDAQELIAKEPEDASFATIGDVYADGVTLIFDGTDEPSAKRYKCNMFAVFKAGDRARIIKDSGTYIVEYPVGVPQKVLPAAAKSAAAADHASTADRWTTSRTLSLTGDVTGSGSVTGASNVSISTTLGSLSNITIANLTSSGIFRHTGTSLAFFNQTATSRKAIAALATGATLAQTVTKVNDIISAFKSYGLMS